MRKFIQTILTSLSVLIPFACITLGTNLRYVFDWANSSESSTNPLFDCSMFFIPRSFGLALSFITAISVFGIVVLLFFLTPLRRLFRNYELARGLTYDPDKFQPLRFNIPVVLFVIAFGVALVATFNGPTVAARMIQFVYWPVAVLTFLNEIALLGAVVVMLVSLSHYDGAVFYKAPAIDHRDGVFLTVIKCCNYRDLDYEIKRSKAEYMRDCEALLSESRF